MPGQDEQHTDAATTRQPRAAPPNFTNASCAGSPEIAGSTKDERPKQQQHRHQIQNPLENDRGKRGRRVQRSRRASRYGRSTSPTAPAGEAGGKPDDGRLKASRTASGRSAPAATATATRATRTSSWSRPRRRSATASARRVSAQTPAGSALRKKNASRPNVSRRINPRCELVAACNSDSRPLTAHFRRLAVARIRIRKENGREYSAERAWLRAGNPPANSTQVSAKYMGKRELLLIVGFVIAGAIVYQATAPAPAPGTTLVLRQLKCINFRRHLRGNRASADLTTTTTHPVDAAITELRIIARPGGPPPELTITGEDRADIECRVSRPLERLRRRRGAAAGKRDDAPARRPAAVSSRAYSIRARARSAHCG